MTRRHYLLMRNPKQLSLKDLPKTVYNLFHRYRAPDYRYDVTSDTRSHGWIAAKGCNVTFEPASRLVWRIHKQHRPRGLDDESDPSPDPFGLRRQHDTLPVSPDA